MIQDMSILNNQVNYSNHICLFLDYDGTLADFAPNPDIIFPDPKLISLFQHLAASPRIQPIVLSGRKLSHLQKLIPVMGVLLAGTYGLELRMLNGEIKNILNFEKIRPTIKGLLPLWNQIIQNYQGFYVEDKGWSLALHARFASEVDLETVMPKAKKQAEALILENEFCISETHRFLELLPKEASKANAFHKIVEVSNLGGALPIYIGDDDKDEKAFIEVINSGGFAVRVASASIQTNAQFQMKNPTEVREWLYSLALARK